MKTRKILNIIYILILLMTICGCSNSITTSIKTTKNSEVNTTTTINSDSKSNVLKLAEYPIYIDRPEYKDFDTYQEYEKALASYNNQVNENVFNISNCTSLVNFIKNSVPVMMENEEKYNTIYSPYNVYQALSILTETTSSTSRDELLALLGVTSIEELRNDNEKIFKSLYKEGKNYVTRMGSSLWLRNSTGLYNDNTLSIIKDKYYTSSYSGVMGSEEYNNEFRTWMNNMTNNLLKEQVDELKFDPTTMFAIISTLYYKTSFKDEFNKVFNTKDTFTNYDDKEVTVDFMNRNDRMLMTVGTKFTAVSLFLNDDGRMLLILPNQGYTNDDLKNDQEFLNFIVDYNSIKAAAKQVKLKLPKFDVESKTDLIGALKTLGINKIFNPSESDFSSLVNKSGLVVDKIIHGVRVKVDEEGIEGAAYTYISTKETAIMPTDEVDFILNRPFMFVVESSDNIPIFIGEVNELK